MKKNRLFRRSRTPRKLVRRSGPNCEQALRACEAAALRVRTAGDELAASWTALCQELSTSRSTTDLLRRRAWCNVLELRLKEQEHALEAARQTVDAVWSEAMIATRAREMFRHGIQREPAERIHDPDAAVRHPASVPAMESCRMAFAGE